MTTGSAFRGVRISRDQRLAWLRLIRADNIGPATFRSLINHYGSAQNALDALPEIAQRGGSRTAYRVPTLAAAAEELERTEAFGARLVAIGEPDYPPLLKEIPGPPPLITVFGGSDAFANRPTVGIVGSRNASVAGQKMAEKLAVGLGAAGLVVASGLARGIDAAAHRAALASGTVAVVASGIDRVYPEEHADLARAIVDRGGVVLTEMPFGWVPRAQDFPRRNRLISGISLAIVVVEAALRSGSLHTVRFALEQGRDVFAVPGSPLDPRSEGTNKLIRDGATLVRSAEDVLDDLRNAAAQPELPFGDACEEGPGDVPADMIDDAVRRRVIAAMGPVPTAIDDIALYTGLKSKVVNVVIVELDLQGRIERHGSQLVSLID